MIFGRFTERAQVVLVEAQQESQSFKHGYIGTEHVLLGILKENGYDVTKTGKTTSISKTIITNKKELETDKVKEIKNLLGVGSISNKKNLSSKVHLTIVIGKDFNE